MTAKQKIIKMLYPLMQFIAGIFKKNRHIHSSDKPALRSFYGLTATLNNGKAFDFAQLKNKKVLIVNTASDCGFTPQYEELEKLYQIKKDSLTVLAFPANDFHEQESGDDATIAAFCKKNYGVSFPIMHKSKVLIHPAQNSVYDWLTDEECNGWNVRQPSWNFCKYLISRPSKSRF